MEKLPNDVLSEIGLKLKPYDLFNFLLVNKKINRICNSDYFWRRKIEKDYSYELIDFYKTGLTLKNPKEIYMKNYNFTSQKIYNFISSFIDTYLGNIKGYLSREYRKNIFLSLHEIQENMSLLPLENVKMQIKYVDDFLSKYLPYRNEEAFRKLTYFISEMHIDSFISTHPNLKSLNMS
jgi:hypothetical protein